MQVRAYKWDAPRPRHRGAAHSLNGAATAPGREGRFASWQAFPRQSYRKPLQYNKIVGFIKELDPSHTRLHEANL